MKKAVYICLVVIAALYMALKLNGRGGFDGIYLALRVSVLLYWAGRGISPAGPGHTIAKRRFFGGHYGIVPPPGGPKPGNP